MLACWNLKTTDAGIDVAYSNLQDSFDIHCGVTQMPAADLLEFMILEGGGGNEVVFKDGKLFAHLMPMASDSIAVYLLTGSQELQG